MKVQTLSMIALVCICLAGCRQSPKDMIGASLADVESRYGVPDIKTVTEKASEPTGTPTPVLLKPGDTYLFVEYSNIKGRKWLLTFVKPDVFGRIKGKAPGSADWYLLETVNFDKDLVF
jgi:hypothetical protein